MRKTGNSLIVPGEFAREKKMSAFKTISFLVSNPENELSAGFSDHLDRDEGDHTHVPRHLRPIL